MALTPVHLSLATAVLLVLQTGGFVALYWPVAGKGASLPESDDGDAG
jgi:hypothetical protein